MRRKTKKTQRDIADAMDWSLSKMIRIENGEVGITPNDLKVLLGHYGITEQRRIDPLVEMARASRGYSWSDLRDFFTPADLTYFSFEAAASYLRTFQMAVVPGLLQTEEYARAILQDELRHTGSEADRRWQARQRRQELHDRDTPPEMSVVLDEAVIRRYVGGSTVMRRQLEELKRWSDEPHINLQVLPFKAGAHRLMRGPIVLLEFADAKDDDLLYQEHTSGAATTRDDPDVTATYLESFFDVEAKALPPKATIDLLDELIDEMGGAKKGAAPKAKQEAAT